MLCYYTHTATLFVPPPQAKNKRKKKKEKKNLKPARFILSFRKTEPGPYLKRIIYDDDDDDDDDDDENDDENASYGYQTKTRETEQK